MVEEEDIEDGFTNVKDSMPDEMVAYNWTSK